MDDRRHGAKDAVGLSPSDFTVFNGEVFFFGFDQFGRGQLWETNGINAAGTQVLTVADASTTFGLSPLNLEVYNGQLLFQGLDNQLVDDGRHGCGDTGNNPRFGDVSVWAIGSD